MTPRNLFPVAALALLLTPALLAACGGGGGPEPVRSQLTDPRSVPTATPWVEPPEVIFLEPGAITPISEGAGEEGEGEATDEGEVTPEDCGETYTVQSGDYPGLIAEKCGVDVKELLEANPEIDPTGLHPGDVLSIPQ